MTDPASPPVVTELGDRLYMIDALMEGMSQRLACYFYDTPEPLIIDAGPSLSFPHLQRVLAELGVDHLARVLLTHVHIDHAGGAGHFAAAYPDVKVVVHHRGGRHLADPSRLWRSAARIYGEQGLADKWGEMVPVADEQIEALYDGDVVGTGERVSLRILDTPGHAQHHIAIFDPVRGGAFVGDAAGVAYPSQHPVQANAPPPDFDPHLLTGQLRRIALLDPDFVGFAHYGPRSDVPAVLEEAEDAVWDLVELVESNATADVDELAGAFRQSVLDRARSRGAGESELTFLDEAGGQWDMHILGVRRWLASRVGSPSSA